MSFDDRYTERFRAVIVPAIESLQANGVALEARRVDTNQTGDSILTEIVSGIAHARLVLADVSSVGVDRDSDRPYRNGNVMYEVGVALACRQPQDVLLVRDDHDRFLFDVSTIPHLTMDFAGTSAREVLIEALSQRLREQDLAADARVALALAGLSNQELSLLKDLNGLAQGQSKSWPITGTVLSVYEAGLSRLIDKGLICVARVTKDGHPSYSLTSIGRAVAAKVAI